MFPSDIFALPVLPMQIIGFSLLGYLAVLVTPGPNMLAIGGVAALRGLAAALPLCGGIALGAGALAAASGLAVGLGEAMGGDASQALGRAIGGLLLLVVAGSMLRPASLPADGEPLPTRRFQQGAILGTGFGIAVGNPVTAAYFIGQFMGPLRPVAQGSGPLALGLVVAMIVLAFSVIVAATLSRPTARRMLLQRERAVRRISAAMLAASALALLRPLLG